MNEDARITFRAIAFSVKPARTVMVVRTLIAFRAFAFDMVFVQFRNVCGSFVARGT